MAMHADSSPSPINSDKQEQALAARVAAAMFDGDAASRMLGMRIEAMDAGYARLSMRVREDMVNGHAICHGGLIFTLADSAFAFACNSDNQNTVAAGGNIEYLRPGMAGDVLTAEAQQRHRAGRTGIFDVTVSNQNDETVALFRGKCQRIRGEVIETENTHSSD